MRFWIALFCLAAIPVRAETIGNTTLCFVPGPEDCALVAAAEIAKAQRTLDMQAYNYTEPHIAKALIDAHNRGVAVRVISDKSGPTERGGQLISTAQAGIPVWIDNKPRIAHNKVIVVDEKTVETGSFNWTTSADTHNAENLIIIHDREIAEAYERNFQSRLSQSETLDRFEAAR